MKAKIFELEAQLQGQEMAQELEARTTELASVRNELELMKLELTDTQQCARVAASDCCMPASFVPNDPSEIRCVIEPLMRSVRK